MTWTKSDIRAARKADLVDILTDRSYLLYPLDDGNFRVLPDPDDPARPSGIVIKQNYWIWPDRDLSGNTIDFFVLVEGKTFHQAMEIIRGASHYDSPERKIPEDRGYVTETVR